MLIPHNPERLLELASDSSIIVEGKRDKKALKTLGFLGVLDISGYPIDVFIKKLSKNKKYIVLTDYDREGERKNNEICILLQKLKFKIDLRFRGLIKSCFGITKIEELIKFSKIEEDYHGKISTINYKILNRSRFYRKWYSRKTRCDWSNIWADRRSIGSRS